MSTACRFGLMRDDPQRHQDRVGVGRLDGLGDRRAGLGLEVDVAADQVDLVADALEEQHPLLVEVERVAAHAAAAGDGDRAEERLVELVRPDLHVEVVVLLIELEEAVEFLGPADERIEVGAAFAPVHGHRLAVRAKDDCAIRHLTLGRRPDYEPAGGESHGGNQGQIRSIHSISPRFETVVSFGLLMGKRHASAYLVECRRASILVAPSVDPRPRSEALPRNALQGEAPPREAEPRRHCVPRQSLGTRECDLADENPHS